MNTPVPVVDASSAPKATKYEIAAWLFVAAGVVFILYHHLLSALLSGLFVFALVHRLVKRLAFIKMEGHKAKMVAVLIICFGLIGLSTGIILTVISLIRGHIGDIPQMMEKMTKIVDGLRDWFGANGIGSLIPDAEAIHTHAVKWLQEHSAELKQAGSASGMMFLHALIGVVIGAMLSFHTSEPGGPLAAAFYERVTRFAKAFQQVFFAQVKISAMNTAFTAVYLLIVLPLFGVALPFRSTLVVITFIMGLIPVVGNLVSNTVIVLISLGISPGVAVGSLTFLVVIHKLEYFLNAKIVGGEIHAAAWEILLAMVAFESAFGIPGVIIAPIAYAYMKAELKDKKLI